MTTTAILEARDDNVWDSAGIAQFRVAASFPPHRLVNSTQPHPTACLGWVDPPMLRCQDERLLITAPFRGFGPSTSGSGTGHWLSIPCRLTY